MTRSSPLRRALFGERLLNRLDHESHRRRTSDVLIYKYFTQQGEPAGACATSFFTCRIIADLETRSHKGKNSRGAAYVLVSENLHVPKVRGIGWSPVRRRKGVPVYSPSTKTRAGGNGEALALSLRQVQRWNTGRCHQGQPSKTKTKLTGRRTGRIVRWAPRKL